LLYLVKDMSWNYYYYYYCCCFE